MKPHTSILVLLGAFSFLAPPVHVQARLSQPSLLLAQTSQPTESSPQNSSDDTAVRAIALALVKMGQYDRAMQLVQTIADPHTLHEITSIRESNSDFV